MLLICLRDDIPLSLNEEQFDQFQMHIRDKLYNQTGKYHDGNDALNNLDVHQIHNIFFCDINDSSLYEITFIPDVVCNLSEPAKYVAPASDLVVYDDNTANADLHSVIFNGNRISFYIDHKIRFNSKFDFREMLQNLLPFIQLHLAGQNISDIYCKKNMRITQVSSLREPEFSRSVLSYIRKKREKEYYPIEEYNLDNQSVIERLLQDNWYIFCNTNLDMRLLLRVCDIAGLKWNGGHELMKLLPDSPPPVYIVYSKLDNALFCYPRRVMRMYRQEGSVILNYPTLTDWFFHAIKK